ncbi:regulatory protein, luxR family [Saccharopolyspora antimicrobica]|uniref:ATPase n=1 Tax=Saccharopolyspora antimicrobica TaxID=455193 RepID=A0A1I5B5P9_9PSEU|nr:helix-turn-helix transcriptional regulator [Saccharopolyspora antimicrobica]RKT86471.1 putative ATPase [Saccharopolyspora antimicrobica]SFN69941.1 regulatory protein, luxR family [Saccharopolyspora antimicrobica]
MLHGRDEELAAVDRVLVGARAGRSGVLVVRGEAGIGKSALLEHAAASAAGMRVLRGVGIESEAPLPFAGLHLLLNGLTDRIGELPEPQSTALRSALSLAPSQGNDRFLVGVALLTLLSELAEEQPLLCIVDDAHWLDHASNDALLFAARRLEAEPIALLFAARDLHAPPFPAHGVAELRLTPLPAAAAQQLLDEHAGDLPRHVQARIAHDARGNPLALHEYSAAQRAGRPTAQPAPLPAHSRIQQTFAGRIEELPTATRTLLLVTAAEATGRPDVVFEAARKFGAGVADLAAAEHQRLVRHVDGRLDFRHPLIRSAVYQSATLGEKLAVHAELAEVFGWRHDICQRAWHLAAATTGPDEAVAAALVEAGEADRALGGYASVAAAYERAAALSPDPADRGARLLTAAHAAYEAGQNERVSALASEAAVHLKDPKSWAECQTLHATLADEGGRPLEAHRILVDEAAAVAEHDERAASRMLFSAVETAWVAADFDAVARVRTLGGDEVDLLARAALGLNAPHPDGLADGVSALRALIDAGAPCLKVAWWHLLLGDHRAAHDWSLTAERETRSRGAVGSLLHVLGVLARTQLHQGQRHDALASGAEALRIAKDIGQRQAVAHASTVLAHLAAMDGDEQRCADLAAEARRPGVGHSYVRAACALGLLDLGLGRHEAVWDRLSTLVDGANRMDALSAVPDLVEAAARLGRHVHGPVERYVRWAELVEQPWARGIAQRCLALLGPADEAEHRYAEAVHLGRQAGGRPFELARTELLYGEWLRRQRRRIDARPLLRSAAEEFERLGAEPWAKRARAELRATGETQLAQAPDLLGTLTPQELQVVRLASEGLSNRDIGAQLFLSPRTVGYHLYKAYPKLGITSRNELARVLQSRTPDQETTSVSLGST